MSLALAITPEQARTLARLGKNCVGHLVVAERLESLDVTYVQDGTLVRVIIGPDGTKIDAA